MIDLKVEGRSTFLDLVIAGKALDGNLRATVREVAKEYRGILRQALSGVGSGKQYGKRSGRRYKRSRQTVTVFGQERKFTAITAVAVRTKAYTASAPGDAPAKRTGNLARAASSEMFSRGYGARVFVEKRIAFYRHFLEFGTKERFERERGRDFYVKGKRAGTKRLVKGKSDKSVGRVLPRPVLPAIQAQLNGEMERRLLAAVGAFTASWGK